MRLFEHADYEQAILQAAEHFRGRGLRPAIIEKDYLVTEALRVVAATGGDRVIFKGGTSLSKGWNLNLPRQPAAGAWSLSANCLNDACSSRI